MSEVRSALDGGEAAVRHGRRKALWTNTEKTLQRESQGETSKKKDI